MKHKGITLIALVITVVILIILAGVTISKMVGGDSLIGKANEVSAMYNESAKSEAERLKQLLSGNYIETPSLPVPDLTEANVTFTYAPDTWTNGEVQVTISTKIEGYTLQYSLDGINWNDYTKSIAVTKNKQTIYARLTDGNRQGDVATGNVSNIDIISPKEFRPTITNIQETELTIVSNTEDGEVTDNSGRSGIKEYRYYIKKTSESNYKETVADVTGLDAGETYNIYVEAYDNAGNKRTSSIINVNTLKKVPDLTDSNVTFKLTPDTWTNENVQVEINTTEKSYILQYSLDNGNTWTSYTNNINITENVMLVARLVDGNRAGGTSTVNINIIDKQKPSVPVISGGGNTYTANKTISVTTASIDNLSGISHYEYLLTDSTTVPTVDTSKTGNLDGNSKILNTNMSNYYIYVRAVDNAGNISNWSNSQIVNIDINSPIITKEAETINITEGDSNLISSYFTINANGNANIISTMYTINGTEIVNTNSLLEGRYQIKCNVTKSNGKTAEAIITIVVEKPAILDANLVTCNIVRNTSTYMFLEDIPIRTTAYYAFGTDSTTTPISGWKAYTEGEKVGCGGQYIWVKLVDNKGNESQAVYKGYKTDVCFVENTKILTKEGLKNIQDIKIGDLVYTMNMENMKLEIKPVIRTFVNTISENTCQVYINSRATESTIGHNYYEINKGWIKAKNLKAGDILLNVNGDKKVVEKVEIITKETLTVVYNFEVKDNHNYFVGENGILVHNVAC